MSKKVISFSANTLKVKPAQVVVNETASTKKKKKKVKSRVDELMEEIGIKK